MKGKNSFGRIDEPSVERNTDDGFILFDPSKHSSDYIPDNPGNYFKSNLNPDELENELMNELNPPLNLKKNNNVKNKEYRCKLSELRRKK